MNVTVLDLIGKTVTKIVRNDKTKLKTVGSWSNSVDREENLVFYTECGKIYAMHHVQDCCECVSIEDIIGNLDDLVGSPITMAEEVCDGSNEVEYGSETWTFYRFATLKGYVTIRWYGSSNGYYSESVNFDEVKYA
jgi:hypothetical protein